jgi:hypothetical protein
MGLALGVEAAGLLADCVFSLGFVHYELLSLAGIALAPIAFRSLRFRLTVPAAIGIFVLVRVLLWAVPDLHEQLVVGALKARAGEFASCAAAARSANAPRYCLYRQSGDAMAVAVVAAPGPVADPKDGSVPPALGALCNQRPSGGAGFCAFSESHLQPIGAGLYFVDSFNS